MRQDRFQKQLGAGGAATGQNRQCGTHDAANGGFCDASEMFGENAAVGKLGGVVEPANEQDPIRTGFFRAEQRNLRNGNYDERLKVGIERPDVFGTGEETDGGDRSIAGLIVATVDHDECAEFASFFVQIRIGLRGGNENGQHEQHEPGEGGQPTVPETKRQNYERGTDDAQDDAENGPKTFIAANVEQLRKDEHGGKKCADGNVAESDDTAGR